METMVNHICPVEECVMMIEAGKPSSAATGAREARPATLNPLCR